MKPQRPFEFFFGLSCLLVALLTFFILPEVALYINGRRNFGNFFRGIDVLVGEPGARYFAALPFALFAWFSLKRAWKPRSSKSFYDTPSTSDDDR